MNLRKLSLGIVALAMLSSCSKKKAPTAQLKTYKTMLVQKQDVELQNVYPVTIKGQTDVDIRPRIEGFIDAIYVDEGSSVKKGQRLFLINSPKTDQAVITAKADVENAKANVASAKINVDKTIPLAEKGIVSDYQLQTVKNAYEAALARLAQANASLSNADTDASWKTVTSPVDGIVGTMPYRVGNLVSSTNSLTMISSTGNVYANFSLSEKDMLDLTFLPGNTLAEKIKNAPPITLTLADGTIYSEKGKLETISGVIDARTGSVNVRTIFPNTQGRLRSGSTGNISIPEEKKGVIVIPQKITFAIQDKILTFVVQGDSVVAQKVISVQSTPDGRSYVVNDGLTDGDKIVNDGIASLKNGDKIKVQ